MDDERIEHLVSLLWLDSPPRGRAAKSLGAESAGGRARATSSDILDKADASLTRSPEVPRGDWEKAHGILFTHARQALQKLERGDRALTTSQAISAEAVIISDGTRPSFLLCKGEVAADDPFIGTWRQDLAVSREGMTRLAGAVGRIQPENGHASNFIGTGTLIDRTGLVLTNYHVIKQAEDLFDVRMKRTERGLQVDGMLEIDFVGESCSLDSNKYRIVEVLLPEGFGETFSGFDVALARIEIPQGDQKLPAAVPLLSVETSYAAGAVDSLALVGFPAAPQYQDGDVDWNFVIKTLFGNKFGVKRLAPGKFTQPLGSHRDDQAFRRAIGHDATTFGGASGALVTAWQDTGEPCFAIHFGGATGASNYALSFAAAQGALDPLGVHFGHPA
jgi:hypothetical protein